MRELNNRIIEGIFRSITKEVQAFSKKKTPYDGRHTSLANQAERGHDCGINQDKIAYDNGNSLFNSLLFYQRRTNFERERLDRTPGEAIDYGQRWFWSSIWQFLRDPARIEFLFSAIDYGLYAGKARSQITAEEYRARKYNLPHQDIGKRVIEKLIRIPLKEYFLSLKVLFSQNTPEKGNVNE